MPTQKAFTKALIDWFSEHGRHDLPWRQEYTPYQVWVAEVMLQQTQVARVAGQYYVPFLEAFPTIESLSKSSWEQVYPYWKGLGFYGRGKRMILCADAIMKQYNGVFPKDISTLKTLPGIGNYTAHAICAFAWDWCIPAVDTNIEQLIGVLFPEKPIIDTAQALVKLCGSGRMWNEAMMDLMSAIRAQGYFDDGAMAKILTKPVLERLKPTKKTTKKPAKKRKFMLDVGIGCIHDNGKYLIQQRKAGASHALKWEFPGGKREKGEDMRACVKREIQEEIGVEVSVRPYFHEEILEYERINMRLRFHRCQIQKGEPRSSEGQTILWIDTKDLPNVHFIDTSLPAVEKLLAMKS